MAVKYAVANGNWNAGATWNDGVVPTSDDDVYANNHNVTINVATLIIGSINTIANAEHGIVQGGAFLCSVPTSILASRTCDLRYCSIDTVLNYTTNNNANCYFTTPLLLCNGNGLVQHTYGNNRGWVITANIVIDNASCRLGYGGSTSARHILQINGNITSSSGFIYSGFASSTSYGWTITINGNVYGGHEASSNNGVGYVTINGNKHYCSNEYDMFRAGGLTINGSVTYEANNGKAGIDLNHTTILNPSTFTWKDVTEPRSNPFIIVTDAEMNNRQQYPPEDVVKQGVEYVWGEIVGTYQQPPEAVVLKDYVYDNDDKIGTLEIPQAPTTSDIVNAIKNDSDLGVKINTTNTNVGNISTAVTTIDGKVDIIDTNVDTLLSRLTSVLTQRLGQSVTVEILQQILVAHLDN